MYRVRTCSGFTLLEVLLAVVFLALLAMGMTAIHVSGLQSLDEQADRMLLDGKIRSRMEVLIGTDFAALSNGSEPVTVRGTNYTIAWSVVPVDLDGDANPEPTAKKLTVGLSTGEQENGTILNRGVANNNDDAEEDPGGGMSLNNDKMELGQMEYVGVRFVNVTIPQGADVVEAYVQFRAAASNTENTDLTIYGEDTDNSSAFGQSDNDISNRPQTTAYIMWNNVPNWSEGQSYQSPSIIAIIQEIVDRPSWSSGNAMALLFKSTDLDGKRLVVSHDHSPANAPLLHVEYCDGCIPSPSLRLLTTIIVDNEGKVGKL